MVPIAVLVMDSHLAFLRFVVQYLDEQHSQMIHVAGASLRASDALTLAAVTHPHLALIGMSGSSVPH